MNCLALQVVLIRWMRMLKRLQNRHRKENQTQSRRTPPSARIAHHRVHVVYVNSWKQWPVSHMKVTPERKILTLHLHSMRTDEVSKTYNVSCLFCSIQ